MGRLGGSVTESPERTSWEQRFLSVSAEGLLTLILRILHTCALDNERRFLMNVRSTYGVYTDDDTETVLVHYDYERDPQNQYPPAHIQVAGSSDAVDALSGTLDRDLILGKLHLPVGERRFRPSIEDIVEFLIVEDLVEAREGALDVVRLHRADYHRKQLSAAIRRDPDTAAETLARLGYGVTPPADAS